MALRSDAYEEFSESALRMTALTIAHESRVAGATTGGILIAAELVYKFLTGGAVVTHDGMVKVVMPEEAITRH